MALDGPGARRRAWRYGRRAELLAAFALRLKGYRIVARAFRTPQGEIDIVARRGRVIAFVEVKARADHDAAAAAIAPRQRQRIRRAAEAFLQRHPKFQGLDVRFDAVLVRPGRWPLHLRDAWRA